MLTFKTPRSPGKKEWTLEEIEERKKRICCWSCQYFLSLENHTCIRYPPQFINGDWRFGYTEGCWWCGEWVGMIKKGE